MDENFNALNKMLKRFGLWVALAFALVNLAHSQSDAGKLKGKVIDVSLGEPVEFATVIAIQNGIIRGGANTDENGEYSIAPLTPGTYTIKASFAGNEVLVEGVTIITGKTNFLDIELNSGVEMEEVVIEAKEPVFEKDQTQTGGTLTGEQIQSTGLRNINTLAAIVPGVYQSDDGGGISIRGGRANATTYYIDGVKVRGVTGLPQKSIAQLSVITGGTPAEYGDMIGGIVSITTAGPSYKLSGGAEFLTSEFLDPYGYNLIGLNLSGPIITRYDSAMEYKKPILGFFLAAEGEFQKDSDPSAIGVPVLKDEVLEDYQQNPLQLDESGNFFLQRANFTSEDDIFYQDWKPYNRDRRLRATGRLDFEPVDNIIIKVGGTFEDINSRLWSMSNTLFAPEGTDMFDGYLYRGWVRFQQNFESDENSNLKNLYYFLQADYNVYHREFMHAEHKENLFDYGYIGSFEYGYEPIYTYVAPDLNGNNSDYHSSISSDGYWLTAAYTPVDMTFDDSNTKNPLMANYNNFIFDYVENNGILNPFTGIPENEIRNLDFLAFYGGLRNGDSPRSIYSLFSGVGASPGGYSKFNYEQYRLSGQASAEYKGHNLKIGFEFEQRIERYYGVAARYLWNYMRQLTNRHLSGIDHNVAAWSPVYVGGYFQDTVNAPLLYVAEDQSDFDRNLRAQLGLDPQGLDLINIDAMNPSDFSLELFSADELLNDGNYLVNYYGYDYKGNKTEQVAAETFFEDSQNRPMNPFAPTYIAGFIQDKFELEDIIFNVGVRVDRFDANQKVLKDPYVLYPTYSAAETHELLGAGALPGGITEDAVAYVDNATNPTAILGYRDGNSWFDRNGSPVSSAELRVGGKVQPHVKQEEVGIESFKDYEPQTNVMPRLSFSFPISDQAVFFAHYDVLTQRPGQNGTTSGSALAGQLADYYYLQNSATVQVTNPNLKPEKTIDYEVGFKQGISDYLGLSISAFYREMRNLIQTFNFNDAYPVSYTSFDNIDFGTVKGFTFALNMVRYKNIRMNASYTLQFANGTGSSFSSSRNALNSVEGFTAIRALLPLDFDQRHRFSGNIDYRYYGDNKGPSFRIGEKTIYPLANAGANLTFYLGSGTPYSVNALANAADVQGGVNQNIQLAGTPNGSRLPWQLRFDFRVDKDFTIGGKTDEETGKVSREYSFNVYLLVLNLLDTKNVLNVYKTSGLPDDDGYLTTGVGQQAISAAIDPDSFTYLYTIKAMNPNNYSLPRRIRLGVQFFF